MSFNASPPVAPPTLIFETPLLSVLWSMSSSFMCYCGAILYLVVDYFFVKYRKTTFKNSFYTLAVSLSIPDIVSLLIQIFVGIPTHLRTPDNIAYPLQWLVGFVTDYGWFVLSSHMLIICINRLVAVVMPTRYQESFKPLNVYLMIGASYLYGACMIGAVYGCECVYIFSGFSFIFKCNFNGTCAGVALKLNNIFSNTIIAMIIASYAIILFFIRKKSAASGTGSSTSSSSRKKEMSLMFQFGVICIFQIIKQAAFWVLLPMMQSKDVDADFGQIFLNTLQIVNYGINPFLYLGFGTDLKQKIFGNRNANIQMSKVMSVLTVADDPLPLKDSKMRF